MKQEYQFRKKGASGHLNTPPRGKDAQAVGERLEWLRERGHLTTTIVVQDATPPSSPLHEYFEWRDGVAADKWRNEQARELIASVYVVATSEVVDGPVTTRAFVSVEHQNESRYEPIAAVLSDAALYAQVCRRAHSELMAFQDRYADFFSLRLIGQKAAAAVEQELHTAAESVRGAA